VVKKLAMASITDQEKRASACGDGIGRSERRTGRQPAATGVASSKRVEQRRIRRRHSRSTPLSHQRGIFSIPRKTLRSLRAAIAPRHYLRCASGCAPPRCAAASPPHARDAFSCGIADLYSRYRAVRAAVYDAHTPRTFRAALRRHRAAPPRGARAAAPRGAARAASQFITSALASAAAPHARHALSSARCATRRRRRMALTAHALSGKQRMRRLRRRLE